ncbi:replication endonuclease [Pseudomonas lutea]|uniref:Replication endonuclease n=1 Tax=Pseudomonas lutea TaxID=243924 RepID=A0ABR9ACR4_9PSED|nr:replication endonuclease [Pseudomonas lutea]MBD8123848.1 replication endonuclease [Pseudomonas lutea]
MKVWNNVSDARNITLAEMFEDYFPTQAHAASYFIPISEVSVITGGSEAGDLVELSHSNSAVDQIANYGEVELTQLARFVAMTHRQYLASASIAEKSSHVNMAHAFGVMVRKTKQSTLESLVRRLKDARWWRRQINRLADERREHLAQVAGKLGRQTDQQCCSAATMEIMRDRKLKTDKFLGDTYKVVSRTADLDSPVVFSLLEVSQAQQANRINELYVDIKAMEKIAAGKLWGWMFVTLTASAEYHSNPALGKKSYNPDLSPRDANRSISQDWVAIRGALKEQGLKPHESYFGFRVTEVHEDGCPHWHLLIFHAPGVELVVEKAIRRLYHNRSKSYFEKNKDKIMRIGLPKEDVSAASAASYIYGYLAFALSGGSGAKESSGTAYKYQCAIRAMGARQYELFGICGSRGKLRALARVKRLKECPEHISKLANRLHVDEGVEGRNEIQLSARMEFLLGDADKIEFIKEKALNSLGELKMKVVGVKHKDDDSHVVIAGLCEDIETDLAKKILTRKRGKGENSIVVNYSRGAGAFCQVGAPSNQKNIMVLRD